MKIYRTVIEGHLVEVRLGDLGSQQVLVEGRPVSQRRMAGLTNPSHHFDLPARDGGEVHVEVRRMDLSKLGLGRYRIVVLVDGKERSRLEPIDPTKPPTECQSCGYSLDGQPVEDGEVRCPECGRRTPAAWDRG